MTQAAHPLHRDHPRRFAENRFVYPVLSRRSGGVSLGVNLNPDKRCNFDCVYCQVDRSEPGETRFVETERLADELRTTLRRVASGELFTAEPFSCVPAEQRTLRDLAFSGDGEPTSHKNFDEVVELVAGVQREVAAEDASVAATRLVLITNASLLHRPHTKRALRLFDGGRGEVWAKLDAGTEAYFRRVARTVVPFGRILDNLVETARERAIVVQSMFLRLDGEPPSADEVDAYCGRLSTILAAGGAIDRVQAYTVARKPAEPTVAPLSDAELDTIVSRIREQTGLRTDAFYSA